MKVAIVANTCWNIYNFRKGLVHDFLNNGDEVIVLAPKDAYTEQIQSWGLKWIDTPLEGTGTNPIKDFRYLRQIQSTFKRERPDVAISFTIKSNIYSSLAGSLSSVPVICNVSGLGTVFLVKGLTGAIAKFLYRLAFRSAAHVFFQNTDDKDLFISHIPLPDHKIGMLPGSGINLDEFQPIPQPLNRRIQFLMIARLIVEKGVREYADAAKAFAGKDSVKFLLVGKLDEEHSRSIGQSELNQWIEEQIIEYHPHSNEIKRLIAEADAVVLPSYREGTPRTLLEGAAIGRPLLATDVAGCKEVVRDGFNGFLFKPKSAKNLEEKMRLFLSLSVEERVEMGMNSRKLVAKVFDEKKVIDIYRKAIHRIMDNP